MHMDIVMNGALLFGAILLIAALSGVISEKVGVVNIAINGLMIIGALVFSIFAAIFNKEGIEDKNYTIIFAVIIAGFAGAVFALLHAFMSITLKADHVVSGTAINLLAAGLGIVVTTYLAPQIQAGQSRFIDPYIVTNISTDSAINPTSIYYAVFAISIGVSIWVYFKYTRTGLRHSAIGENPNAADSAAINVIKYKWLAVTFSGFLAGIAGAMAVRKMGQYSGNVQGLGFVALGIMIIGQWKTIFIVPTSIIFAIIYGIAYGVESTFVIPKELMQMLPFVGSLLVLVFLSKFQAAPKAVGQHFDKAKR